MPFAKVNPKTGMPVVKVVKAPARQSANWWLVSRQPGAKAPGPVHPKAPPPYTGPPLPEGAFAGFAGGYRANLATQGVTPGAIGGGSNVDYRSLVENDPGYVALKAELAAGNISAAQFRKQAVQRALIAFGRTPGATELGGTAAGFYNEDVDQLTRDLAAKNTAEGLSTTAQLDRAHQVAVSNLQNTLAARGMLESGATGVGLGLEEQRNKEETTGKTRELIDYLSGQAAAYAQHLHESKLQEASALQQTTQAYMGMAGQFGWTGPGIPGGDGRTDTTPMNPVYPPGQGPLTPAEMRDPYYKRLATIYKGTELVRMYRKWQASQTGFGL